MADKAIIDELERARQLLEALEHEVGQQPSARQIVRRLRDQLEQAELSCTREHQFQSLVENATDGIARFGRHCRFQYVNPAMQLYTGLRPQQCVGKTHRELGFPPAFCDMWESRLTQVFASRQPLTFEFEYVSPTGHASWHQARLVPENDPATGEAESVLCVGRDITEAKQYEQALRDSEERFRLLVDGVKDYALFLLDSQGYVTSWNKGAERLKGYRAEEIIGKNVAICYAPEDIASGELQRHLEEAARQGQSKWERLVVRKDGSRFWAEVLITALRSSDGTLSGFAEVAQDITDRKRAEEELKRAKEAAEKASRAKDHFLAVLSHELRTPLTPVLTTVQMTERQSTLSPDLRESLSLIHRNVELEARLIDDLLDVTRISRGKIELHVGSVDVHSVLRHVIEVCHSDIRSKRLNLTVDLGASHHHVQGDSARLQQVFWNLLKNAVKFTPADGSIQIRSEQRDGDRIAVTVSDTGVGIEPELLPHIFNVFEQGSREITRQFGGLGLGLAISKGLMDLHGGTIAATSEGKGKGACFTMELPISLPAETSHLPTASGASTAAGSKGGRLLLVEDHPDTARTMAMLLRSYGFQVQIADSVSSALHAADAEPFDLLISDLGLPDGSGLDLMRQMSIRHPMKAIAVSGFGMEEDVRRSREAGFAVHLTKPINVEQLESAIQQVTACS